MRRPTRRTIPVVAALAAVFVAGGAVAVGSGVQLPFTSDGKINACYSKDGEVRLLTPAVPRCPRDRTPISWNQSGPAGPQGAPGPSGTSVAYAADGSQIVDDGTLHEVVALRALPAGSYVFTTTLVNKPSAQPDAPVLDATVDCFVYLNDSLFADGMRHLT